MDNHASAKKTVAKRVLAALLAALMLIAALPATVFATDGDEYDIVISRILNVDTSGMNRGNGLNPIKDYGFQYYYEGEKISYTGLKVTAEYYYMKDFDKKGNLIVGSTPMTDTFNYSEAAFDAFFVVEPANGTALTLDDNLDPIKVSVRRDRVVAPYGQLIQREKVNQIDELDFFSAEKLLVERFVPKYAKLVNSFKGDIDNQTKEQYVIVIDGVALTHNVNKEKVTIRGKEIPAPLTGKPVTVKGDTLTGVTNDMLWSITGDKFNGYDIYYGGKYTLDGILYATGILQFDGKTHMGDLYGGQAVASTLALSTMSNIHGKWFIALSEKQNNFAETYLYTQNNDPAPTDANPRGGFKFSMDYDKATNCFYGKYENEDKGRDVFPNILTEEGKVGIYKVSDCYLEDFEVITDPSKMSYVEGETFNPQGMQVKFIYNNGESFIVNYEDFAANGIVITNPFPYQILDTSYNGNPVSISVAGFGKGAYTKGKLTVKPAKKIRYELVNELESGSQYVIAARVEWGDTDYDFPYPFVSKALFGGTGIGYVRNSRVGNIDFTDYRFGLAISSKKVNSILVRRWLKEAEDPDATTLTARPVAWSNNRLIDIPQDPQFTVSEDQIWTVIDNGSAKNGYSIISSDGRYLVREPYLDKNEGMPVGLINKAGDADLYKWNIPGTNETVITSANGTNNSDPYYLFVGVDVVGTDPSMAFNYETATIHKKYETIFFDDIDQTTYDYLNFANFVFFKVIREAGEIKSIKVKDQPLAVVYADGDAMDLSGMSAEITYGDGNVETVQYSDFAAYGITVSNLTQDQKLSAADNGKKIKLTVNGKTAESAAISVLAADKNTYTEASTLADGDYVIVFSNEKVVADTIVRDTATKALSSIIKKNFLYDPINNERINTLRGTDVTVENGKITSKVTKDLIWTIKGVKNKAGKVLYYTIQSSDGKYLEMNTAYNFVQFPYRAALTTTEKLTLDPNGDPIVLNNWQITGTKKAEIFTGEYQPESKIKQKADADTAAGNAATSLTEPVTINDLYAYAPEYFADKRYITLSGYDNNVFIADATDFAYLESITLYGVNGAGSTKPTEPTKPAAKAGIVIKTEPDASLLKAKEGDKFAGFGALEVTITKKDGTKEDVKAADFAAKGITTDIKVGDTLTVAHNNKPIKVSYDGASVDTATKFVIESKPALTANRLAGADRIATAIAIAKAGWSQSDTVVLANSKNFPDALVGVPLAAAKNAPILLTPTEKLDASVSAEIQALKAKKVILLGGTAALSADVEKAVKELKVEVERLGGATRFETSILIANAVNADPSEVFLVSGKNESYPDALSISSVAGIKNAPVVYVSSNNDVQASVANYLNSKKSIKNAVIVGGSAAVSDSVYGKVAKYGFTMKRIAGADRYATSLEVAKTYDAQGIFKSKDVAIATGVNYPDALAGGALAAQKSIPVILVNNGASNAGVKAFLAGRYASNLYVFGGTTVISDATVNSLIA